MTFYEIEAVGEIGRHRGTTNVWAKVMVPLVTAALVITLGLILVGVTSGTDTGASTPPPTSLNVER